MSQATKPQIITDDAGAPAFAVLPWSEYEALVAAAEDAEDGAAVLRIRERLASGAETLIPAEVVDALDAGENPVRVFRRFRDLRQVALAEAAGIRQGYLSEIERGAKAPSLATTRALARALEVDLELLLPDEA